jgi:hypothetical protein
MSEHANRLQASTLLQQQLEGSISALQVFSQLSHVFRLQQSLSDLSDSIFESR